VTLPGNAAGLAFRKARILETTGPAVT